MSKDIRIGLIGDFLAGFRYHLATTEALDHASLALSVTVEPTWLSTSSLETEDNLSKLQTFHGLFGAPGNYQSINGAHRGIKFAREKQIPFLGT